MAGELVPLAGGGAGGLTELRLAERPLARRRDDDALRGEWRRVGSEREASRARPRETPPWSGRLGWTAADASAAYRVAVLGDDARPRVVDLLA